MGILPRTGDQCAADRCRSTGHRLRATVLHHAHKDEVVDKYKEFVAEVSNKFKWKLKILRSDNGGEYTGSKLINYLKQEGIRLQTSVPYSLSQNGVAEWKNRLRVEMAKCMLPDAGLLLKYWGKQLWQQCICKIDCQQRQQTILLLNCGIIIIIIFVFQISGCRTAPWFTMRALSPP